MNKPTRFYSKRQENAVAKVINGRRNANSGATTWSKGDVRTDNFLIECKTCEKEKASFSIKKEWLIKNREEAFAMGKSYSALAFDYGDAKRYYVIDEKLFKQLVDYLSEENSNGK